ncbi:MAG: fluoride efflux transporter CrcB [Planctomycetaceae bacterium]
MPASDQLSTLAAVALGGAIGAVARYGITVVALGAFPRFGPAGTLIANVLGCGLIGVAMVLAQSQLLSELQRQLCVTGFLGALTTFSTYSYQTIELAREGRFALAMFNLLSNLVLGFLAVAVGLWLGRRIVGG